MKKFFMIAAAALMVFAIATSCNKDSKNGGKNGSSVTKVDLKAASDYLVMYLPMQSAKEAVDKGYGVSFGSKNGAADFGKGFIGNGFVNTKGYDAEKGDNSEAYMTFAVAADNLFKSLDDFTVTLWIKNAVPGFKGDNKQTEAQKGAFLSMKSVKTADGSWPFFVILNDNYTPANGDNPATQQVNGRLMFQDWWGSTEESSTHLVESSSVWLDNSNPKYAKYDEWYQFAWTFNHATGESVILVDGIEVWRKTDGEKPKFKSVINTFKDSFDAFYVGGWSTKINGIANESWQKFFAGSIDEIRIFNIALDPTQVLAVYKEEVAAAVGK